MKKLVFFGTPAFGHMISVAPAIKRLTENGIDVTWITSGKFRFIVEKAGATFEEYKIDFDNLNLENLTSNFFELLKNLIDINRKLYLLYKDYDFGDSFIVYDSMVSFAKNIARKKKIKSICFVTTMAYNFFVFITSNLSSSGVSQYLKNKRKVSALMKEEKAFRTVLLSRSKLQLFFLLPQYEGLNQIYL